jgi:hypothetical protein
LDSASQIDGSIKQYAAGMELKASELSSTFCFSLGPFMEDDVIGERKAGVSKLVLI